MNTGLSSDEPDSSKKIAIEIGNSFIALHPDTIAYKTEAKSYRWNYEQGLMLDAFYQLWKLTGDDKYFNYVKNNIDNYVDDDGTIRTYRMSDYNIDNLSPGRILLYLYKKTGNIKYRKAADALYQQLVQHPRTESGGFWHKKIYPYQMWLDGLYMAQPFYARYSLMTENPEFLDDVVHQFRLIKQHLKDEETGLYYHGWDESKEQKWADTVTGRSPSFWGRSIGWFMMALVDVLEVLPQDHSGKKELTSILTDLSDSILKFRDDKTGLWFQVPDQEDREGNYIEASSSCMFAYAFAKGANNGFLDKKYINIAADVFNSVLRNLVTYDNDGYFYLNNVVMVGGLGGKPYRDGSFDYYISEPVRINDFKGYGPFLLTAVELAREISSNNKF